MTTNRIDQIEARTSRAIVALADRSVAIPREIEAARVALRDVPDLVAFVRDVEATATAWEAAAARRRDMNDDLFDPTLADSYTSRAADLRDLLDRLNGGA